MTFENLEVWCREVCDRMWARQRTIIHGCLDRPRLRVLDEPQEKVTLYRGPLGFGKSVQVAIAAKGVSGGEGCVAYLNSGALSDFPCLTESQLAALILYQIMGVEIFKEVKGEHELVPTLRNILSNKTVPIRICIDDVGSQCSYKILIENLLYETSRNVTFVLSDERRTGLSFLALILDIKIFEHTDMAFSEHEVNQLLTAADFNRKNTVDAAYVIGSTNGWPALVKLMFQTNHPILPPETWPETISYFEDKLLHKISNHMEDFACKASILQTVNAECFNYVFKVENSRNEIELLLSEYSILQYTDSPGRFEFINPVLRCYFNNKFKAKYRDRLSYYLKRVAFFHWRREEYIHSINTALEASDYRWARVINDNIIFDVALRQGAIELLSKWFANIPKRTLKKIPSLSICYAWVLYFNQKASLAEEMLSYSRFESFREVRSLEDNGWRELVLAIGKATEDKIEESLILCSKWLDDFGEKNIVGKGAAITCQAYIASSDRRFSDLEILTRKAAAAIYSSDQHYAFVWLKISEIQAELFKGNIVRAKNILSQAYAESGESQVQKSFLDKMFSIHNIQVLLELNCEEVSLDYCQLLFDFAISYGVTDIVWGFSCSFSQLLFYRGYREKAYSILEQVRISAVERGLTRLETLAKIKLTEYRIFDGEVFNQSTLFNDINLEWTTNQNKNISAHKSLLYSINRIYFGKQFSVAEKYAKQSLQYASSISDFRLAVSAQYCQAAALFLLGSKKAAKRTIVDANLLAEHLDCNFTKLWIKSVLEQACPIVTELFNEFPGRQIYEKQSDDNSSIAAALVEANTIQGSLKISTKQISLLKCVSKGMTNKEIAESLLITEDTVKWHLKKIFNGLDVNNRVQAVSEARRRGLL